MNEMSCQFLVIGAGPGGYVAAIRAGQLGLDTVVVDSIKPGGTCLNIGCIPSKALIHAADEYFRMREAAAAEAIPGVTAGTPSLDWSDVVGWKDGIVNRLNNGVTGLFKKARVKLVEGRARFVDGKTVIVTSETGEQRISAETVVIATGSEPIALKTLPFGGKVISSTEALSLSAPPETLAVVGGGYIGVELGTAFAKAGSRVTIVEAADEILPLYDGDLVKPVRQRLQKLGVTVMTGATAQGLAGEDGDLIIETTKGEERRIACDRVLVTVGRRPVTEGWGRDELVLEMDGPFIRTDDSRRTAMCGVYAIGDVAGEPMLAHKAMAEGEMVAEIAAGHRRVFDHRAIPTVCFTDPEIVTVGLSPLGAKAAGIETTIGRFPLSASGRAMSLDREDGFVRVVARTDNHLVLGIEAVGATVSELSAAFSLALEMGACLEDVAGTIHAHPTLGESFQEAALAALGKALHV
ncbi:dihydrolipoyl dehydrogenase [Jiella sp. MQZ9-1]|uniref:Dihydrolipoyl dehydrogenase n=1 Tax=Jiella flava TaxID=2816857 RepID=A0A939G0B6_9HYPH|nr:dihydrolipoyl dehydrogenase [Jiella flava]MBO0664036.1 dihydrolipoyl dehydrogenase [Jiella flava]MCD2472608.1 dihydrolipoyl dehydrogenase [Jiella flava]